MLQLKLFLLQNKPLFLSYRRVFCGESIIMKGIHFILLALLFFSREGIAQADKNNYLEEIKNELRKEWPNNRTINLVFHGHSVPAGYAKTPEVRTFDSYPFLVLKELKIIYPTAVINVIVTAIGGENSSQGVKRFKKDVLIHKPDVLFIDYALNDRKIGLEQSRKNMEKMIKQALRKKIKIILMTPSADLQVDVLQKDNELELFEKQIINLALKYKIGVSDSYGSFKNIAAEGKKLNEYMAQSNHPNKKGNELIAEGIMEYFK
jgi:hypothetical protein